VRLRRSAERTRQAAPQGRLDTTTRLDGDHERVWNRARPICQPLRWLCATRSCIWGCVLLPSTPIDVTARLNADTHHSPTFFLGIPGGTGSILVSRLSTAWHVAASAIPRNMAPTSAAGEGVSIARSSHLHHDEPSPRTVMLVLLLVSLPVGVVYFFFLRVSTWLAASFTFSMLALIFLCIAVRLSSPSTHPS
jgi:hypothetical protein